jgi:hypothetical protein
MTDPSGGFQAAASILDKASGGFHIAAGETKTIMFNLEQFILTAMRTYQGAQARAFQSLHIALQDEQTIIKEKLLFLEGGSADGSRSVTAGDTQIAEAQANLGKTVGDGGLFSGFTVTT